MNGRVAEAEARRSATARRPTSSTPRGWPSSPAPRRRDLKQAEEHYPAPDQGARREVSKHDSKQLQEAYRKTRETTKRALRRTPGTT